MLRLDNYSWHREWKKAWYDGDVEGGLSGDVLFTNCNFSRALITIGYQMEIKLITQAGTAGRLLAWIPMLGLVSKKVKWNHSTQWCYCHSSWHFVEKYFHAHLLNPLQLDWMNIKLVLLHWCLNWVGNEILLRRENILWDSSVAPTAQLDFGEGLMS